MNETVQAILTELRGRRSEWNIAGMRRFGITTRHEQLGVSMGQLRKMARPHRRNHTLALALWETGVMEAMLMATFIEEIGRASCRERV